MLPCAIFMQIRPKTFLRLLLSCSLSRAPLKADTWESFLSERRRNTAKFAQRNFRLCVSFQTKFTQIPGARLILLRAESKTNAEWKSVVRAELTKSCAANKTAPYFLLIRIYAPSTSGDACPPPCVASLVPPQVHSYLSQFASLDFASGKQLLWKAHGTNLGFLFY